MELLKRLLVEENGQGLVEYTLIVVLVALVFWVAIMYFFIVRPRFLSSNGAWLGSEIPFSRPGHALASSQQDRKFI